MYRKILVPLDGSPVAERILPYVEELAMRFHSSVILLKVLEPVAVAILLADPLMGVYVEDAELRQQAGARIYLNKRCIEFHQKGIDVRKQLGYGNAASAIVQIAEEENVDLIAMASPSHTSMSEVLHETTRPLLLIKHQD